MSKKIKQIKSLKKELKELKAEVRKLKLASASRRKNKMKKALGQLHTPAPTLAKIERAPEVSSEPKSAAARVVGQH